MSVVDLIVVSVFTLWLLLTLACQFETRLKDVIARHDVCGLVPHWTFFAPNPLTCDYCLIARFREKNVDQFEEWSEVTAVCERRVWAFLWNPEKRLRKVLADSVNQLVGISKEIDEGAIQLTVPYLSLLSHVSKHVSGQTDQQLIQFAIASIDSAMDSDVAIVFLSHVHSLG